NARLFGRTEVLARYDVSYYSCATCGFLQTEEPHWLNEAYSKPLVDADIRQIQRSLVNAEFAQAVIQIAFPRAQRFLDYGSGYGILVRTMRDRGFNFFVYDKFAPAI